MISNIQLQAPSLIVFIHIISILHFVVEYNKYMLHAASSQSKYKGNFQFKYFSGKRCHFHNIYCMHFAICNGQIVIFISQYNLLIFFFCFILWCMKSVGLVCKACLTMLLLSGFGIFYFATE